MGIDGGRWVHRNGERQPSAVLIRDWQRAIGAGDESVWDDVRVRTTAALERATRSDRRARQEAEDLADDFVTAELKSRGASILAAPGDLGIDLWIHGVARVLLKRWRARPEHRLRSLDAFDTPQPAPDSVEAPPDKATLDELNLDALTPRQREAVLAHKGAPSVSAIARELGVDPSRARELIAAATRHLVGAVNGAPRNRRSAQDEADRSWARAMAEHPSLADEPELRRMLELFASGLSHREIAARIEWPGERPADPREAVRQRLRRARERWDGSRPDAVPPPSRLIESERTSRPWSGSI